jgi:hypothetical protein
MFRWLTNLIDSKNAGDSSAHPGNAAAREARLAPYYIQADDGSRVELLVHARMAGRKNLPETNATMPNDAEGAVQREYERQHQDVAEGTRRDLGNLAAAFDRLERQLPVVRDLTVAVEAGRAAIEGTLGADQTFIPLRQDQQRRRRELNAFERANHIAEAARYPASVLRHLGILSVLVVLESLLNSAFFAQASAFGLVGGFLVAVGVSLVNVALGALTGFAARWRNHPEPRLRRLATVAVVTYGAVAAVFNLGVGHLRDLTAGGATTLVSGLLRHPFALSFASAVLVVVGVLASLLAFRKGHTADSRVPGHGEIDRAFRAADERFREHHRALRGEVLDHAQRVPGRCRQIVEGAERDVEEMAQTLTRAGQRLESYAASRARFELVCAQHLHRYRNENIATRTTPPPAYFEEFPAFPVLVDGEAIPRGEVRLQQARHRLDELKAEAQEIGFEQPGRIEAARDRFEGFVRGAVRRADVGRGDGSTLDAADEQLGAAS